MALGAQLVRSILETGASSMLRDIRSQHLKEDELPVWDFVRHYYTQHGQLPSVQTVQENGFVLERCREPASYYADRIRKRFTWDALNAKQADFRDAMVAHDPETAVAAIREMLSTAGNTLNPNRYSSLNEKLTEVWDDYQYAKENPGLRGVTLGWPTLNFLTMGAQGGDVIVLAGRPSMGKSWLLLEMAHKAWKENHSVVFISMEMTLLQIARRWVALSTGINPNFIRSGQLSQWGESSLRQTIMDIQESASPVHFLAGDMEKDVQGVSDMCDEFMPDAIYIDAAYLLSVAVRNKGGQLSKWEQIAEVIEALKKLSIRINRPIIITVQFNRNVKSNSTKALDLSDIGGTDVIPQASSIVMGIQKGKAPYEKIRREIDLMKNREGDIAKMLVNFRFTPVDMTEVETYMTDDGLVEADEQHVHVNSSWML